MDDHSQMPLPKDDVGSMTGIYVFNHPDVNSMVEQLHLSIRQKLNLLSRLQTSYYCTYYINKIPSCFYLGDGLKNSNISDDAQFLT